jgi:K+-sensing histidine kinase KdpD
MPRYLSRDRIALVAAVLAPLAVAAVLVPLRGRLSGANAALVLVVVVVAVASNGHRVAGALSAVSAAAWFDFFLTQPYERFTITRGADITTAVLLLVVGLAVSQLAARARRLRVVTITSAEYLAQIQQTAQLVQSGAEANAVVEQVRGQLTRVLGLRACRFEYGNLLGQHSRLTQDGSVVIGQTPWNVERDGMPTGDVELRVADGRRYYGRFVLQSDPETAPSLQARLVAVTLADQVAGAFHGAEPRRGRR